MRLRQAHAILTGADAIKRHEVLGDLAGPPHELTEWLHDAYDPDFRYSEDPAEDRWILELEILPTPDAPERFDRIEIQLSPGLRPDTVTVTSQYKTRNDPDHYHQTAEVHVDPYEQGDPRGGDPETDWEKFRPGVADTIAETVAAQIRYLRETFGPRPGNAPAAAPQPDLAPPSDASLESVMELCAEDEAAYYTVPVVEDAARVLDTWLTAAERQGRPAPDAVRESLTDAALIAATLALHDPQPMQPDLPTRAQAITVLRAALEESGIASYSGPVGLRVAPLPDGRTWGNGEGLWVEIHGGIWTLRPDLPADESPSSMPVTVHGAVSADGARAVAGVVRGVLDGVLPDHLS
ncbi:hypothetical protein ACIOGZ_28590 [Kitasatospora sp. NPDC088160]|uniref:hypothetical protein n=1 Tax=Kitasatospora sp. NPDC088160 TaxID=3364072 RepID=UPI0037F64D85